MHIIIYIILGLLTVLLATLVAGYFAAYAYLMKNPEKLLELKKLNEEMENEKVHSLVCEVCIKMRLPKEIRIMTTNITDQPSKIRYCGDNPDCQALAFTRLSLVVTNWRKELIKKQL